MTFASRFSLIAVLMTVFSFAAFATNPVINGQTIFSDTVPTLTNCGVSPAVATGGTSNGATITVGAATNDVYGRTIAVLQCTVTFATAFTNPAVVGLSVYTTGGLVARIAALSTTVMVVYFSQNAAGGKFSFVAF